MDHPESRPSEFNFKRRCSLQQHRWLLWVKFLLKVTQREQKKKVPGHGFRIRTLWNGPWFHSTSVVKHVNDSSE